MTATITTSVGSFSPRQVTGYEADTETDNVFHVIIGRQDRDVSLNGDGLRQGTLELVFDARADAWAAQGLLTPPDVFTLADTDAPEIGMAFVRNDRMTIRLDTQGTYRWLLAIGFQEVAP